MPSHRLRRLATTLVLAGLALATGQKALATEKLISEAIDETRLVSLPGNTRPEARAAYDRGALPADFPLEHVLLQLQRSPAGERAVEAAVDALHDPASPRFHQWLTAAEFGREFGTDPADLAIVEAWLASHGLRVNAVHPGRMVVDFSGTAGQLRAAFHTELHRLEVHGQAHFAAMGDPRIPAALAPVVAGLIKLDDFRPIPRHRVRPRYTGDCSTDTPCYLMAPADLATIYDFNPLFHATQKITGKGQTIAVVEDTDLYSTADWTNFRQIFGLAGYTSGSLETIQPPAPAGHAACSDPGVNADGDDVEAAIDAEWASAAAPDATIIVAACDNTNTIDGVEQAIHHLVNSDSPPDIISVSYGICEAENTAADNTAFAQIYQQAVAEGISVFVATGDDGPEDCAPNFTDPARYGIGVNAWASTRYNVAVGGTDFGDTAAGTNATYWGPSTGKSPWGTAKSYIPEIAWNDTCASDLLAQSFGFSQTYGKKGFCNSQAAYPYYLGTGGGEGGPSGCATGAPAQSGVVGGTCQGWPKPGYQQGIFGMPANAVRDLPDVAMFAADGVWSHQFLLCFTDTGNGGAGSCSGDPASWGQGGGGTSYATPIVAGIQALVNQKMAARQGNPNHVLYRLGAAEYGTSGNSGCNSSLGAGVGTTCVFRDVTAGSDAQDCAGPNDCFRPSGTYGVMSRSDAADYVAYKTHPGWDYPTGLGTIDAANLVNAWAGASGAAGPARR
jgi:subtilase family serine protease